MSEFIKGIYIGAIAGTLALAALVIVFGAVMVWMDEREKRERERGWEEIKRKFEGQIWD